MNEEHILAANKIIGQFMGWVENGPNIALNPVFIREWRAEAFLDSWEGLDYAYNWNSLMFVVQKIESIFSEHHGYFGVHISSNSCTIQGTKMHRNEDVYFNQVVLENKKESTFFACLSFITWYKENQ